MCGLNWLGEYDHECAYWLHKIYLNAVYREKLIWVAVPSSEQPLFRERAVHLDSWDGARKSASNKACPKQTGKWWFF